MPRTRGTCIRIWYEKACESNLSGNEFYCTACSLLATLKNSRSKLNCWKFVIYRSRGCRYRERNWGQGRWKPRYRGPGGPVLQTKCFESRFVEVNFPTNLPTYPFQYEEYVDEFVWEMTFVKRLEKHQSGARSEKAAIPRTSWTWRISYEKAFQSKWWQWSLRHSMLFTSSMEEFA